MLLPVVNKNILVQAKDAETRSKYDAVHKCGQRRGSVPARKKMVDDSALKCTPPRTIQRLCDLWAWSGEI